ncbi:MAG: ROK family protein [Actinomycetota bacterium]|jgi:polyphosphate glucokinase|nr:ROK family protein [Actinomycetota bacterium]
MEAPVGSPDDVLAIDIGATNIKFARVDALGRLRGTLKRRPTPYPCSPERLVEWITQRTRNFVIDRVGVGFPGEFEEGHVVRPGNLSRVAGVDSEIDAALDGRWQGFALEATLRRATGRDVRVVNDATLAALGCCRGDGVELVMTLGTGCGLALRVQGDRRRVRDLGRTEFDAGRTFDQALGEKARAHDTDRWRGDLVTVVNRLAEEFHASRVYLAGGNARRVSSELFNKRSFEVEIVGNEASLRGAAHLFGESTPGPTPSSAPGVLG